MTAVSEGDLLMRCTHAMHTCDALMRDPDLVPCCYQKRTGKSHVRRFEEWPKSGLELEERGQEMSNRRVLLRRKIFMKVETTLPL